MTDRERTEVRSAQPSTLPRVRRRHVLYLAGFDPQGPGQYHSLYSREAALQAPVSGYEIEVGPRQRAGPMATSWDVSWRRGAAVGQVSGGRGGDGRGDGSPIEIVAVDAKRQLERGAPDAEVDTRYELLRWDDIVRRHWPTGRWAALRLTLMNSWQLTRNGSFWWFLHISWPAVVALAAPGMLLLAASLLGLAVLGCGAALIASGHSLIALALVAVAGSALFGFTRWAEDRLYMGWLMRSTRVILRQARGEVPELEDRLDQFAERVLELAGRPDLDELLVVGHSSGAMLAASVMARALRRDPGLGRQPDLPPASLTSQSFSVNTNVDTSSTTPPQPRPRRPAVALLTLGHCMPLLSCQPEAQGFRLELAELRRRGALPWVDFTAPADGCCSALTDPTALHVTPEQRQAERERGDAAGGPKLLSPRFNKLFSPQRYAAVRSDKYRCHFQYLMATELHGDYDYFAITAGPIPLAVRFADRISVTDFTDFQLFGGNKV